jgi:hypothetical protein
MLCDMKVRLGGPDEFVVWPASAEQSPPGVDEALREGLAVDLGVDPPVSEVEAAVAAGRQVLVSVGSTSPTGADPALLAVVSVYAWVGVRLFRVPKEAIPPVRQVLDMVASIQGVRPPTLTRRGLA